MSTKSKPENRQGIRVCYKEASTDVILWDTIIRVEGRGRKAIVRSADGGWNYACDCFFTEEQCRRYYQLPAKNQPAGYSLAQIVQTLRDNLPTKGGEA